MASGAGVLPSVSVTGVRASTGNVSRHQKLTLDWTTAVSDLAIYRLEMSAFVSFDSGAPSLSERSSTSEYMAFWNCIRKIKITPGRKNGALFLVVLAPPSSSIENGLHPPFPSLSLSYPKVRARLVPPCPSLSRSTQLDLLILIIPFTTSILMSLLLLGVTLLCLSLGRRSLFLKRAMQQVPNPYVVVCAAWRMAWTG